ncbi:heparan-alpha-glucosaminide N-acetyltransferase domain-containing protein [Pelagicoccus sp. SDUM812002]|uniref:acyltransferase family protein n=1 Tax=Pelagicoccus sp. SDUM812002 TaxID=3041266 RepID=UPI00280E3E58|nr:heparan-alpha-glucosaminide N-acetyltransferase domain-containing protein [Pelagicoccus sp. SDUM812002]MDQ8186623.1 heparan-alpha-glucosaminide N-acetyltransferase domain-containing protein [Pelagicoccus sp. SDUM812002]
MVEKRERLLSLDALRGFTIIGMIIVNSPGSWSYVYGPLLHAPWHGVTVTDMVFPFFLFIVGVSIALAYTEKPRLKRERRKTYRKIGWRVFKIFTLGVFLNLWPWFNFEEIRVVGVLQRIAVVFGVCAILFVNTNWRQQLWIGIGVLVLYWALLQFVPVPLDSVNEGALRDGVVERALGVSQTVSVEASGELALQANLEPGTNLQAWIDRKLVPGQMWERTWDPEGILSTLPAVATGIFGLLVGSIILGIGDPYRRVSWLYCVGFAVVLIGEVWSWDFPLNKNLWSSSFVLFSGGWSTLCLATSVLLIDIQGYRKWAKMGVVFGSNPVVAYALSGLLTLFFYSSTSLWPSLSTLFVNSLMGMGASGKFASICYALLFVGVIYLPVHWLWKRRLFIKL